MSSPAEEAQTVLVMGFGNAGERLYGNALANEQEFPSVTMLAYDANKASRHIKHEASREALETAQNAGRLIITHEIAERPADVVIIATPPGAHANTIEQVAESYSNAGFPLPKAWVIEKAVVSSLEEEKHLRGLVSDGTVNNEDAFVNETRLLSPALISAANRARELEQAGHTITGITALAQKNRIPQVQAGRFSGRPFDVEVPHTLVAAQTLGNTRLDYEKAVRNILFKNIDSMPESEGTYTEFLIGGLTVRLAQGLGEYTMDPHNGNMYRNPKPDMLRTVEATFNTGDQVRVRFDPLPGRKLTSTYTHTSKDGRTIEQEFHPEKPINILVAGALRHARGEDAGLPAGARIEPAMETANLLMKLQDGATVIDGAKTL